MPELDEAVIKRVLPHSIEAEQSVIGAMLLDKEAITVASEQINGEDFYGKQYGILFDAMIERGETSRFNDTAKPFKRERGSAGDLQFGVYPRCNGSSPYFC